MTAPHATGRSSGRIGLLSVLGVMALVVLAWTALLVWAAERIWLMVTR